MPLVAVLLRAVTAARGGAPAARLRGPGAAGGEALMRWLVTPPRRWCVGTAALTRRRPARPADQCPAGLSAAASAGLAGGRRWCGAAQSSGSAGGACWHSSKRRQLQLPALRRSSVRRRQRRPNPCRLCRTTAIGEGHGVALARGIMCFRGLQIVACLALQCVCAPGAGACG